MPLEAFRRLQKILDFCRFFEVSVHRGACANPASDIPDVTLDGFSARFLNVFFQVGWLVVAVAAVAVAVLLRFILVVLRRLRQPRNSK